MRLVRLAAAVALTLVAAPAVAGSHEVTVVYGIPPFGPIVPPYQLDPSDQGAPVYIVDQGPVIDGPGIYAYHKIELPTYLRGGYAVVTPDAYATPFPYVHRVPDARFAIERPYGVAPYGAYLYRRPPNARVIHVR